MKSTIQVLLVASLLALASGAAAQGSVTSETNVGVVVQSGNPSLGITSTAPKQEYPVQPPVSPAGNAQLFEIKHNNSGLPVEVTGSVLGWLYNTACAPEVNAAYDLEQIAQPGESKKTFLTFNRHQYGPPRTGSRATVAITEMRKYQKPGEITELTFRCLGAGNMVASAEALKAGYAIDVPWLVTDIARTLSVILSGEKDRVTALTDRDLAGGAVGVVSKGGGSTGGVAVNWFPISFGGGKTETDATALPGGKSGIPFLAVVLTTKADPYAVTILLKANKPEKKPESSQNPDKTAAVGQRMSTSLASAPEAE